MCAFGFCSLLCLIVGFWVAGACFWLGAVGICFGFGFELGFVDLDVGRVLGFDGCCVRLVSTVMVGFS